MEFNPLLDLGEDFLPEFLKKLPIDSICRFLCVSKSWNSLISSSFFIKSYTSASPVNPNSYLKVSFRDQSHNAYVVCNPQVKYKLHFLFRFEESRASDCFTFVGVVHGVVCVSHSLDSSFDSTILWNPKIQRFVTLPLLPFLLDLDTAKAAFDDAGDFDIPTRFDSNAIGFGFDGSKNDFKVVRIWIPSCSIEWRHEPPPPTYEVYSTRDGVWRVSTIDHLNIRSCEFNTCGTRASRTRCFVNGTIYWLVSTSNDQDGTTRTYSLLTFDCAGEEFMTLELPKEIYQTEFPSSSRIKAELLEYDGMLLVLVHSCWSWRRQIELWAMEEDSVGITNWKKLLNIPNGLDLESKNLNDQRFMFQPLIGKLAPNSPSNWMKLSWNAERFDEMLSYHVYEESLYLMDDSKAKSYAKEEIVYI